MKIKSGFISNSSSTSFCIVGIYIPYDNKDILKKLQLDREEENSHGCFASVNGFSVYGSDGPQYIGIPAEEILAKHTLPKAIALVQKMFKKYDIEEQVQFLYGEAGEG